MAVIHLKFRADVSEEEAWDIAEKLEEAAVARDYREVTGWVESGRTGVLGSESDPPSSSAMSEERQRGGSVTAIGDPGADPDGPAVMLRRYGQAD